MTPPQAQPGEYEHLGNFSAAPPWHSSLMSCDDCRVTWTGCWDNFECPKCGKGELPGGWSPSGGFNVNATVKP